MTSKEEFCIRCSVFGLCFDTHPFDSIKVYPPTSRRIPLLCQVGNSYRDVGGRGKNLVQKVRASVAPCARFRCPPQIADLARITVAAWFERRCMCRSERLQG